MNVRELYAEVSALHAKLDESAARAAERLACVHPDLRASAENLIHYLALRAHDYRALQESLASHGLSSLGRSESHVKAQIDAVLRVLAALSGERVVQADIPVTASGGRALLHAHTNELLGASRVQRSVRVMVTLATEVAHSPEHARALIAAGMDLARINCAHDDLPTWRAMARNVRDAAREAGRACMIAVDLAGPKCRTGALAPGPEVIRLKAKRNDWGELREQARAFLTAGLSERAPALQVPESFLDRLQVGTKLKLRDARGKKRWFSVKSLEDGAVEIVGDRTAYVRRGTRIHAAGDVARIVSLPRREGFLLLKPGDVLALTRRPAPARSAKEPGELDVPSIPCEPAALLDMLRVGQAVWFDDGRIGGVAETVETERTLLRITNARARGEKLRAGKGINLPDTAIDLPALTEEDHVALSFAVQEADVVQMSFVRAPEDVVALQDALTSLGRPELGVVLKIETRAGFERLPDLLLTAMQRNVPAVMIARGDLAVECGFERMSEVQEEILWMCEAAHVPVVWATQVLETMAKERRPTRAEISDVAMAERAECVMLNKGPYIIDALKTLDDILRRMSAHQEKKTAQLRALGVAQGFASRMHSDRVLRSG